MSGENLFDKDGFLLSMRLPYRIGALFNVRLILGISDTIEIHVF